MININKNVRVELQQASQPDKSALPAKKPKVNEPRRVSGVERLSEDELCKLRKIALDRGRELQIRFNLRGLV